MEDARVNGPDANLTNGRFELPASARGVLVLADPPEAGWQLQTRSDERATFDAELLAPRNYQRDSEQDCDAAGFQAREKA
jgi:hypothetical protein